MSASALPYRPHNHSACVRQALADARARCRASKARLTPTREQVLHLIWRSHRALGAYDLLAMLAEDGHKAAPPTVYRALDFLQRQGLVHRIASLNAFIGCSHTGQPHRGQFLICRQCRNVLELTAPDVTQAVDRASAAEAFAAEDTIVEVIGLCPACQEAGHHD
ncbi:MAG: transcriptional repressor [Marinobacter sp.]|nr:transcriptional repressor [Marinobacter sp.]